MTVIVTGVHKTDEYWRAQRMAHELGLQRGSWICVYNGNLILHGNSEEDLIKRSIIYFKSRNIAPRSLLIMEYSETQSAL